VSVDSRTGHNIDFMGECPSSSFQVLGNCCGGVVTCWAIGINETGKCSALLNDRKLISNDPGRKRASYYTFYVSAWLHG
jgi:hypothetical protein